MAWSSSSQRQKLPEVHVVHGRYTVYVSGRRLLAKNAQAFDKAKLTTLLNDRSPPAGDGLRGVLIAKDIISEGIANIIGAAFARLIPRERFITSFLLLSAFALALGIAAHSMPRLPELPGTVPSGFVLQLLIFFTIVLWHELGHMAAARKLGIRVDSVGIGTYIIIPALFTRVSMLALLPRSGRIQVMLAGVFFQAWLGVALALGYLWSREPVLLRLIDSNILIACLNLVPFIKLDGHHVALELLGMMDDRGRFPGARRWYERINRVVTAAFLIYLGYIWVVSLAAVRRGGSSADIAYFAFISAIAAVLLYRLARTAAGALLAWSRSASAKPAG